MKRFVSHLQKESLEEEHGVWREGHALRPAQVPPLWVGLALLHPTEAGPRCERQQAVRI